jgi:hypothetical protein
MGGRGSGQVKEMRDNKDYKDWVNDEFRDKVSTLTALILEID